MGNDDKPTRLAKWQIELDGIQRQLESNPQPDGDRAYPAGHLRVGGLSRRLTSVYMDDAGIKLLVVKGRRVVKWAEAPLEPGLVCGGLIGDEEKAASRLRGLLRQHGVKTKRVIAGLSGLQCLFRVMTFPSLSRSVLDRVIQFEAEREMSMLLGNFYLSWQVAGKTGKDVRVFVLAYRRAAADALVSTLRRAELEPYLMDVAPLAVARMVSHPTAAAIDLRSNALDIVIVVDGIPGLIHSLLLPPQKSAREKIALAKEELIRVIRLHDAVKPENPLENRVPIYASGELASPEPHHSFSAGFRQAVLVPVSPLIFPVNVGLDHFTVNTGLILKRIDCGYRSPINMNLLPRLHNHAGLLRLAQKPGAVLSASARLHRDANAGH